MAEPSKKELLSQSAKNRLPSAIKKLSEKEQAVFVFLRMRRDETFISREVEEPISNVRAMIQTVQTELVKAGALDLISNPVFFPIDHPCNDDDGGRSFELPSNDIDPSERMALDSFYKALKISFSSLSNEQKRLLDLWFNKEMTAKEIFNFYKRLDLPFTSKKPIKSSTIQDVFYEIDKNMQKLLSLVRSNMGDSDIALTPKGLKAILSETGV